MSKKKDKKTPKVNPALEGFDIKIDTFGEIKSTMDIDKINELDVHQTCNNKLSLILNTRTKVSI